MYLIIRPKCILIGPNNPFTIKPKQFYIDGYETKTLECIFQPKTISNVYLSDIEATVHFGSDRSFLNHTTTEIFPEFIAPMNILITTTGL